MAATLTLTGSTGPGVALSAVVYRDVLSFKINTVGSTVDMEFVNNQHTYVAVPGAATVTATKSGTTWTLTIS
jgi:hypothetical protein